MLDVYGIHGAERESLLSLVRQSREKAWWHAYSDLLSEEFRSYIGYEDEATRIWTYETRLIPGLLQAEGYSRAVMAARSEIPLDEVERGMQIRRRRQEILTREEPPELIAIVDRPVLSWLVGDQHVMREQYAHLISVASAPRVTLQVLPFSAGVNAGGGYPFTIVAFAEPADPRIAHAELLTSAYNIQTAEDLGRYHSEFERLRSYALDPAESTDLISRLERRAASGLLDDTAE